jgi:hypothetical protein
LAIASKEAGVGYRPSGASEQTVVARRRATSTVFTPRTKIFIGCWYRTAPIHIGS